MKKVLFGALVAATALFSACGGSKQSAATGDLKDEVDSLSYSVGLSQSPTPEQIKEYLMQAGSDSAFVDEFFKGMKEGMSMADDKKALAYQLGMQSGIQLQSRLFPQVEGQVFAGDSTKHLSAKNVLAGMIDGKNGVSALIVGKDTLHREQAGMYMQQKMQAMAAKANEKVYGAAKKANEEFIAKIAKTAGVKALPGGVYYKEVKAGTGATPKADQICEVSYEGRLMNGKVFDSSQDKTVKFPANQVIKGWTIALTNMKVGSAWEVYIPWNLAYGDQEQGPIPPYSALVFKIKLVSVSDAPAQPEAPQMQKGM